MIQLLVLAGLILALLIAALAVKPGKRNDRRALADLDKATTRLMAGTARKLANR